MPRSRTARATLPGSASKRNSGVWTPSDGEPLVAVAAVQGFLLGDGAQAVDARVGPEIDEHHAPAQCRERDRPPAGVEGRRDAGERRRGAGVGEPQIVAGAGGRPAGRVEERRDLGRRRPRQSRELAGDGGRPLQGLERVRVGRRVAHQLRREPRVPAQGDHHPGGDHQDPQGRPHGGAGPPAQPAQRAAPADGDQAQRHHRADGVRGQHQEGPRPRVAGGGHGRHGREDRPGAGRPDQAERDPHEQAAAEPGAAVRDAVPEPGHGRRAPARPRRRAAAPPGSRRRR